MINVATLATLFVDSWLVDAGRHPEDGAQRVAERFHVYAEFADGARLVHERGFDAQEGAERLLARVRERGVIDPLYWAETQPRYGSAAYVAGAWEEDLLALEAAEEGF